MNKRRISESPSLSSWVLRWLVVGVWLGLLDGAWTLISRPSVAGPLLVRLKTLAVTILVDGVIWIVLVLALVFLCVMISRILRLNARYMIAFLSVANICAVAGVLIAEEKTGLAEWEGGVLDYVPMVLLATLAAGIGALIIVRLTDAVHNTGKISPWRLTGMGLIAAALLTGLVASAWPGSPEVRDASDRPNVILISLDTLRADHLSAYGYSKEVSPHLDALAEEGVLFENAYSQANFTLPSHASMLTGLDPRALRIRTGDDFLDERFDTLAERMKARGYRTAGFVGNGPFSYVGAQRGFEQGFDEYFHTPYAPRIVSGLGPRTLYRFYFRHVMHRLGVATVQLNHVANWLRWHRDEPSFMFVHLFDIHSKSHRLPYEGPGSYRDMFCQGYDGDFSGCGPEERCASEWLLDLQSGKTAGRLEGPDLERTICLYDGGIRYVDDELGRFFDSLRAAGLYEQSLIIVTSDHGEAFFEHGVPLHENVYQEIVHVPLIVKPPGVMQGRRVKESVQVLDIVPTVLSYTGGETAENELQGLSLIPLIADERAEDRMLFSHYQAGSAIFNDRWKLIRVDRDDLDEPIEEYELYDRVNDPFEFTNLYDATAEGASNPLREQLEKRHGVNQEILESHLGAEEAVEITLPESEIEALRSLGYLE